jgi:Cu(I)/Ag(I) efflux system membrane protein CusA/SilA
VYENQYHHHRNYGCRQTEIVLKGFRALVMENEKIRATILLDKGSDVYELLYKPVDIDFMLRSPLELNGQNRNPVTRFLGNLYSPVIHLALKYPKTALGANVLALLAAIPMISGMGSEFMPPLDEGSLLFMPVTLPNVSITEAKRILQVQDKIIADFPEVAQVLGKVGRAETSTDPAPTSMIESIILLKPKSEWRKGITNDDIISQLDQKLQIPGVRNGWTQPIINRINMLSTGVRTDLGVKVFGDNLDTLERLAIDAEGILRGVPGAVDLYAERVTGGEFLDIDVKPDAVARYGINVGDVLNFVETAIGGENVSTTIEGRERYPIDVRYPRELRDDTGRLGRVRSLACRAGWPRRSMTGSKESCSIMSLPTWSPARPQMSTTLL